MALSAVDGQLGSPYASVCDLPAISDPLRGIAFATDLIRWFCMGIAYVGNAVPLGPALPTSGAVTVYGSSGGLHSCLGHRHPSGVAQGRPLQLVVEVVVFLIKRL
eukprot:501457-Amphidinium_carterae.1